MNEKILVADDSPTIQKVVGITLAKSNYELIEALDDNQMFDYLSSDQFDLVLLDFNLSESDDGYALCEKIKNTNPNTKIMVMLGTFDTVEEDRLAPFNVFESVVKPFESSKFIQKINDTLAADMGSSASRGFETQQEEAHEEPAFESGAALLGEDNSGLGLDEDGWSVSGPNNFEEEDSNDDLGEISHLSSVSPINELQNEMEGWGMSVPGVIGNETSEPILPEQMNEEPVSSTGPSFESQSNLVSLDELMEDDADEDLDKTDPNFHLDTLEDSPDLASELEDDSGAGDFWAVDEEIQDQEVSEVKINLSEYTEDEDDEFIVEDHQVIEEVGPKLESDPGFEPTINALNDLHSLDSHDSHGEETPQSAGPTIVDASSIIEELRPQLKELIKEVILEMGSEATEKVAWEVIPDLAENLIRKEVQTLSKKVQDKHSLN